ncbi:hypothetical protein [Moorena producens]|uniref:hypothetical protein n=1 Tax=Moorena producens TaxID=1155739 RepID=UPI000A620B87|nr:hypothetical protein [Moorena producens]
MITSYLLPLASCLLPLPNQDDLLSLASCLLPLASCLLPFAFTKLNRNTIVQGYSRVGKVL